MSSNEETVFCQHPLWSGTIPCIFHVLCISHNNAVSIIKLILHLIKLDTVGLNSIAQGSIVSDRAGFLITYPS